MENWKNGQLIGTEPDPEPETEIHPVPPTIEEQILALQNALISQKISGGGITTVTDSSENRIKEFSLIGKSEQLTTTGKNLINNEELKFLDNYTDKNTTYYIYRLTGLITGEKYTLSRGEILKSGNTLLFGVSANQLPYDNAQFLLHDGLNESYNRKSITWTQENGDYVDLLFSYNSNSSQTTQEKLTEFFERVSYVQLEKGTSPTAYEPYTGGKPSPSPEYPQGIKNVGKWNKVTQKYEVDVIRSGRNTFDVNNYVNSVKKISESEFRVENMWSATIGEINLKAGREYRCSFTFEIDDVTNSDCGVRVKCTNKSGNVKYVFDLPRMSGYVCTSTSVAIIPSDTIKCELVLYTDVGRKKGGIFKDLIIAEENKNALLNIYEPYRNSQTLTLTSDRPITKWDKLVEQDGQIGWLYQSKEIILNGSETEEWRKTGINDVYQLYMFDGTYKDYEVFCDKLVNYKESVNHITENSILANTNYLYVRISGITDIQTLRDFLNSNNLKVVYYSKTQEFIPLPQDEQNAIRALKTYYPTTVITVNGGEVDSDIEVTYIADTKNYIDQKIAAIGKTVVETQKALL